MEEEEAVAAAERWDNIVSLLGKAVSGQPFPCANGILKPARTHSPSRGRLLGTSLLLRGASPSLAAAALTQPALRLPLLSTSLLIKALPARQRLSQHLPVKQLSACHQLKDKGDL